MSIATILANISCADLAVSLRWYETLFGQPPTQRPMEGLAEWHFTDSAAVQLYESKTHAGHSTLTLKVDALEPERRRLTTQGLSPGPIETTKDFVLTRLADPDGNLVVLVSSQRE